MSNCVTTSTEDAPWGPLSVYRDSIIHVKRRSSNCSTSPQLFSPFCPPRVVGDGVVEKVGTRLCGLREFRIWHSRAKLLQLLQHPFSHFSLKMVFNLLRLDTPHVFPSIEMDLLFSYLHTRRIFTSFKVQVHSWALSTSSFGVWLFCGVSLSSFRQSHSVLIKVYNEVD